MSTDNAEPPSQSAGRLFALLLFPCLWGAVATTGYLRHKLSADRGEGVGEGDIAVLLLPSVLIYSVSVLALRRQFRGVTPERAAAFSVCAAIMTVLAVAASTAVIFTSHGSPMLLDNLFFYVVPFVPPFLAIWGAYWLTVARRPRAAA